MNQFKQFSLNKEQQRKINGAQEVCHEDRRVGNCDGGTTQYYFWDPCTGQCRTMVGHYVDDCTPC